jgi:tetratricopeptide (TPR) repeat protein
MTMLADRYRLDALLGAGGMGSVHAGYDTRLERRVAIKLLPEESETDVQARARFRREALAAAALDHPYICKVFEVGEHDGRSFIVMEHVEGRTLEAVIAERSLTPRQVLDLAHELAQALDEAHRRGIVHRDLKPSNIMLTTHGHVKVLDFGLAKHTVTRAGRAGGAGQTVNDTAAVTAADEVTRPGILLGTPSYMSPEQILGSMLDPRSDIFSLGVVLHELACGQHPFRKDTSSETMAAILRDAPRSTEGDLDVVPGFGRLVHRMLAKACAERPQTMREVADQLDAVRERGSGVTPPPAAGGAFVIRDDRTPLVGRDGELAELAKHLDRMLLGQGGLVLIGGEPGVGKTRLAGELQRLAHARGCLVVTGHCYEQEGTPPFAPFVEQIELLLRAIPQAMRTSMGDGASTLALMVPDIARAFPDLPSPPASEPEQQRRALFNAYLAYLQRGVSKSAAVSLLDDLHWADEASVQLLLHVAPHLASMRLFIVGTYRDVDLDAKRPFAKALETLLRQRLAMRMNLKRLDMSGVRHLLEGMSGSAPPPRLVEAIHEETEGNPFFVEEVFQHLREEGKLFDADGRWLETLNAGDIDVPEGVRLVISRRLERLSVQARKVLTAAAVIGRSFSAELLVGVVTDADEDAVLDCLEEALRAQLLESGKQGREARYTFVHELIRSTLLYDLSMPRRQRLHVRIADALESKSGTSHGQVSMLAHHLYQAGAAVPEARAVAAVAAAMVQARRAGAFEDAVARSEELVTFDLPADADAMVALLETRSIALYATGRTEEALSEAERLLVLKLRRGDVAGAGAAAYTVSKLAIWMGRYERGVGPLEAVLRALPADAVAERIDALSGVANLFANMGRVEEATRAAGEATLLAESTGVGELRATALAASSVLAFSFGEIAEGVGQVSTALRLHLASSSQNVGLSAVMTALLRPVAGEFRALEPVLVECAAAAGRVGHAAAVVYARRARAQIDLRLTGNLGPYVQFGRHERRLGPLGGLGRNIDQTAAEGLFYIGDADAAADVLHRTLQVPWPLVACRDKASLVAVLAWSGRVEEARDLWAQVAPHVEQAALGRVAWQGTYALAPLAIALPLMGERDATARLYPGLRDLIARGHVVSVNEIGPTSPQLAAAIAAAHAGLVEAADEHFDRALRLALELPERHLQPMVRAWYGQHLATTPGHDRARGLAMLGEAVDDFTSLGMSIHAGVTREWLIRCR